MKPLEVNFLIKAPPLPVLSFPLSQTLADVCRRTHTCMWLACACCLYCVCVCGACELTCTVLCAVFWVHVSALSAYDHLHYVCACMCNKCACIYEAKFMHI